MRERMSAVQGAQPIQGEFKAVDGKTWPVTGRVTFGEVDAQVELAVPVTTSDMNNLMNAGLKVGVLTGKFGDGRTLVVERAYVSETSMEINAQPAVARMVISPQHLTVRGTKFDRRRRLDGRLRVCWELTGCQLLEEAMRHELRLSVPFVFALGMERVEEARKKIQDRFRWESQALRVEAVVCFADEPRTRTEQGHLRVGHRLIPTVVLTVGPRKRFSGRLIEWVIAQIDAFLGDARLPVSFLAGRHVSWTRRFSEFEEHRDDDPVAEYPLDDEYRFAGAVKGVDREALARRQLKGILTAETLVHAVKRFRENKQALTGAIGAYLDAGDEISSGSFLLLNTAIEALREHYVRQTGTNRILGSGKWRRVAREVRQLIRTSLDSGDNDAALAEQMAGKVPELNRPAYGDTIRAMCSSWQVQTDDLLAGDPDLTFVSVRNDLVHTGTLPGPQQFGEAWLRVNVLAERLICAVLQLPHAEDYGFGACPDILRPTRSG